MQVKPSGYWPSSSCAVSTPSVFGSGARPECAACRFVGIGLVSCVTGADFRLRCNRNQPGPSFVEYIRSFMGAAIVVAWTRSARRSIPFWVVLGLPVYLLRKLPI